MSDGKRRMLRPPPNNGASARGDGRSDDNSNKSATGGTGMASPGPVPLPAGGTVLLASGPLDGGLLLPDTTAWLRADP